MPIECVQTDNGAEFTKRFTQPGKETLTMFQRTLRNNDICHKLIKPFTAKAILSTCAAVLTCLPRGNWAKPLN